MNSFRNPLIKQWILFNFFGWLLGLMIGPLFYLVFIHPALWFNGSLAKILAPIFLSFPLGISIGAMQNLVIQRWNLPILSWIRISILGSVTAAIIAIWLFSRDTFGADISTTFFIDIEAIFLVPIFAGFTVALFQTVFLRKSISKPALWIISYICGFVVALFMVLVVTIAAFAFADSIIKALYALRLWDIVWHRDLVLIIFNLLVLSFWLAIVIGLPTGNILYKNFGNIKTTTDEQ
ncbi:MAG: hypothetical protein AB1564_02485 [Chloroflexota bacterium]